MQSPQKSVRMFSGGYNVVSVIPANVSVSNPELSQLTLAPKIVALSALTNIHINESELQAHSCRVVTINYGHRNLKD